MKLLWVFSTFAIGGPQRRFATLVNSLGDRHTHSIAAMDGCYDALSLIAKNVSIDRIDLAVKKGGGISTSNISTFRQLISETVPDILLTSNWGTIEWRIANRGAVPHIHFEDGFGPDEATGKRNAKRDLMRRVLFSMPLFKLDNFRLIVPSTTIAEIAANAWGMNQRRINLIPNGIDLAQFTVRPNIDECPVTLGTVGALRPEKRIDRLLSIFAKVALETDVKLLLVGDGPERMALEQQATDLGIRDKVDFAGSQKFVAPFLEKIDIFAMTSDTEQMPIGLVEAMACGLPVVASDVGDIGKMVARENRQFILDRDDIDGFAEVLARLAGDYKLRCDLGEANATKARENYSLDKMLSAYEALFDNMVA